MWVSVHALSGLSLGALAPLGWFATIVCALVLHLALDVVPHWDYTRRGGRFTWAVSDVAAGIAAVIALTLLLDLSPRAVVAAVVSALPDLDVFDAILPRAARRRLFPSHWRRFPHGEARALIGVLVQGVVAIGAIVAVTVSSV